MHPSSKRTSLRVSAAIFSALIGIVSLAEPGLAQVSDNSHALITQSVDEAQLTTLKGNTHPLARPEFDLGTAPASLPMERMLLVLKRSPEQETALRKMLDDQQDKSSPNYHKWLTPEQFGKQFGPSDSDLQTITSWLQSRGFQVGTTKGRTVLEFSGSASQVQEAFHTSIHKYVVNGEQHWANASDPQIPTALTPAVAGVLTLHNFIKKPAIHFNAEAAPAKLVSGMKKPQVTFSQNGQVIHALGPQDFATIYNINPVYFIGNTGQGVKIGVVGRSNLFNGGEDISDFHSVNVFASGFHPLNIIVNGPDPGDPGGGEEAEATLDTTWSGAIAYDATVDLVVSGTTNTTDGIDLSELYIVENNLADIMTESFSACELYATDAQLAFASGLAEQAAAQGITYFVSTGDDGAEGCDAPSLPPATHPISVNLLASTAFNVAVGGTMFNENGKDSAYWGTEPPVQESAIYYIPENVWNESSLSNGLWSGSGGASAGNIQGGLGGTTSGVPKPSWQSPLTLGIPNDDVRDLPDVSLTAAGHDPYLLCLEGSCAPNSQGQFFIYFISGTSASAPSFASIMALVDEKMGGRQGQANYVLYRLAAAQSVYPAQCDGSSALASDNTCIFHDVTVGNNVVPGEVGTQYQAAAGYDQATGLGSVNVYNLINNWNTATFNPTTTALKLNGGTTAVTITHGQSVNVTAMVTPSSGTTTPGGDVVLYTSDGLTPSTLDLFHLGGGQATGSTSALPGSGGSSNNVWAHYSGDATYAPSDSNMIAVTVKPEPSATTLSVEGSDLTGRVLTSPFPFGSLVFVRADVAGNSGLGIATGSVTFTDTFGPVPSLNPQINPPVVVPNPSPLNSQGNTSIGDGIVSFDAGNHSISASYPGDPSFGASSSTAAVAFSIQPGFALVNVQGSVVISSPGQSGTASVGIVASTGFTTAVTFTCSGLPAEATCSSASATGQGPTTVVSTNITITTTAPHTTELQSNRRNYYFAAVLGGGPVVGLFLMVAPKERRWRVFLGLVLLALLVTVPACGGGGSSHQTDPGTPTGTYNITVTASAGSMSQQGGFTLFLQ